MPATDWQGVHSFDESPNVINPKGGWLQNTNNWPVLRAGPRARRSRPIPPTSIAAARTRAAFTPSACSTGKKGFTLDTLRDAAFDSLLAGIRARSVPPLIRAYDQLAASSPLKAKLSRQIALLRTWDYRWAVSTRWPRRGHLLGRGALAALAARGAEGGHRRCTTSSATRATRDAEDWRRSRRPSDKLAADFGKWDTPWGEINRFQRLTGDIVQPFDDEGPSIPVRFTSARWGSLASFGARSEKDTKRCTGPAATASWPGWSSATACGPRR